MGWEASSSGKYSGLEASSDEHDEICPGYHFRHLGLKPSLYIGVLPSFEISTEEESRKTAGAEREDWPREAELRQ